MDQVPSPEILSAVVLPGTVCAQHVTVAGYVDGKERILLERIIRLGPPPADDFPTLPGGQLGYRVILDGRPPLRVDIVFGSGLDYQEYGRLAQMATAAVAVNTIPALCAAPPGFHTHQTLPLIVAQGVNWS